MNQLVAAWRTTVALLGWSALIATPARCDWARERNSISWAAQGAPVWKFSFDPAMGKPFFHPVQPAGGPISLTNFKPVDHPWHYGLWFSWKYINEVNYWEEDRKSGAAQGKTRWDAPQLETGPDGRAVIRLQLRYVNPAGAVDLTEERVIRVSAPDASGGYAIDWTAHFQAGPAGALLGRLPMPNEPGGKINGGYAGLSARLAAPPAKVDFVTLAGPVARFTDDRARPASPAVGCNFSHDGKPLGGLAILSAPQNTAGDEPWYLINTPEGFRFACAALLAPHPLSLKAGERLVLHYRVAITSSAWTPASLQSALDSWPRE